MVTFWDVEGLPKGVTQKDVKYKHKKLKTNYYVKISQIDVTLKNT